MKLFNKLFNRKSKAADKTVVHGQNNDQDEEKIKSKNSVASASYTPHIRTPKPLSDITFIYCLVGNIGDERFNKSEQRTYKGTRHFSPGTKVYCFPPQWGDGYEKIKVIGRCRHSHRMITVIIPSKHVTNWRVKTVYKPFILKQMSQNAVWYSTESHKENILSLAASLNTMWNVL